MVGYPLTEEQIAILLRKTDVWTYGVVATVFYWPISQSGRFEGVLYNKDDYLTLSLYEKNLVEVLGNGAQLVDNNNYVIVKYTWLANPNDATDVRWVKSVLLTAAEQFICQENRIGEDQYLGQAQDAEHPLNPTNLGDWFSVKTPIGTSLDFYGYN